MIIGNGLIANAFKHIEYKYDDYIIFASGVSNSRINSKIETERELDLIKKHLDYDKKFIYFSTTSVNDKSLSKSLYIQHKLFIEEFIKLNFKNYIIYRLPIVVGKSNNPNTLTNFINYSILNKNTIQVYNNACRYLIDINDVVKYVNLTLHLNKEIININLNNKIYIKDLIDIFEQVLKEKSNISTLDKGDCYTLDNSKLKAYIKDFDTSSYNYNLINKYYGVNNV